MSEHDENRAYEKGYDDGVTDAQSKVFEAVRQDLKAADMEIDELRERVRSLVSVLKKVEHTVALHGHMDVGTELFDLVCAATQ